MLWCLLNVLYNVAFQDNWTGLLISRKSGSEVVLHFLGLLKTTYGKERDISGDVFDSSTQ